MSNVWLLTCSTYRQNQSLVLGAISEKIFWGGEFIILNLALDIINDIKLSLKL